MVVLISLRLISLRLISVSQRRPRCLCDTPSVFFGPRPGGDLGASATRRR